VTARAGIAQLVLWLRYRPHNLGFGFRHRQAIFLLSKTSRLTVGPIPSVQLLLGVHWPGREVHHVPPSIAKVRNEWRHTSTPQFAFMAWTAATVPFYCESLKTNSLIWTNSWNTAIKYVIPLTSGMYNIAESYNTTTNAGPWEKNLVTHR